jgi:hypothetical protein
MREKSTTALKGILLTHVERRTPTERMTDGFEMRVDFIIFAKKYEFVHPTVTRMLE